MSNGSSGETRTPSRTDLIQDCRFRQASKLSQYGLDRSVTEPLRIALAGFGGLDNRLRDQRSRGVIPISETNSRERLLVGRDEPGYLVWRKRVTVLMEQAR
jgi:hypothetical protein